MKKFFTTSLLSLLIIFYALADKPKYIFFMIGDGMGINQVNLAEIYLAEQQNRIGVFPLVFSNFPFATFATSYSLSHGITDSAAGGTALAVGKKTKNGVIGMDSLATTPIKSIAYAAKEDGLKVGIITSVSIDHATPASFYAHQASRNMYHEIALDLIKSDFDFFGGSGFLKPEENSKKEKVASIFPQFEKAGYKLLYGKNDYESLPSKNGKLIYMNEKGTDPVSLPYAIDQTPNDLKLKDITAAAIESLSEDNPNGFFLMVEGGKIDWAAHSNDAATVVHEVLDFNESVKVALEFYKKHPEETLIVVTADHETGGMSIGRSGSRLQTKLLDNQKVSQSILSNKIGELRQANTNATWEEVKNILSENLGLFTEVDVNSDDETELREAYTKSFIEHENQTQKSLYANDDKIAAIAIKILNKSCNIAWGTGGHSASYIPIYTIGRGAEKFSHKMENTDISKKICEIFNLKM